MITNNCLRHTLIGPPCFTPEEEEKRAIERERLMTFKFENDPFFKAMRQAQNKKDQEKSNRRK